MPRKEVYKGYVFYIITEDGKEVIWDNLSEVIAARLYRATRDNAPSNILKFGWGAKPGRFDKKGQHESID